MKPAPVFHADLADGPSCGAAWCVPAEDGVNLRIVTWPAGSDGTVLLFQGRNEHVEKYGRAAAALASRGFSTATLDWRGQGLSERVIRERISGHIDDFADYQKDVAALVDTVRKAGLPEPYYLIAHSMGGAIGLRALAEGLPVKSAAFSAPMWGIRMSAIMRVLAPYITSAHRRTGFGCTEVRVGPREGYLMGTSFEENHLTHDPEMYAYMVAQARREPRLATGRPTHAWLSEALREIARLRACPAPRVPVFTGLAEHEEIVDNRAIKRMAEGWPETRMELFENARHELMMERRNVRERFFDTVAAHFRAAA